MPVRRVLANEAVSSDIGRIAVERGPLVYCAEGVDNGGRVAGLVLDDAAALTVEPRPDLLNGLTVITGPATAMEIKARQDDRPAPAADPDSLLCLGPSRQGRDGSLAGPRARQGPSDRRAGAVGQGQGLRLRGRPEARPGSTTSTTRSGPTTRSDTCTGGRRRAPRSGSNTISTSRSGSPK